MTHKRSEAGLCKKLTVVTQGVVLGAPYSSNVHTLQSEHNDATAREIFAECVLLRQGLNSRYLSALTSEVRNASCITCQMRSLSIACNGNSKSSCLLSALCILDLC